MSGVSGPKSAPKSYTSSAPAQASHVEDYMRQQGEFQTRFAPPIAVNPQRIDEESRSALQGTGDFYQGTYHVGHFTPADGRDTKFQVLGEMIDPTTGVTPYGQVIANPDELADYVKGKAANETYLDFLRKAEYLVDPKDPRTIKKLYELFPELEKIPETWYTDYQTLQWTLRDLLQYGEIRSREDHALVMYVCSPGFKIPIYPAWDPLGTLIEQTGTQKAWKEFLKKGKEKATFNPFRMASEGFGNTGFEEQQQVEIKALIIRRLYPGCRDMTNDEIQRFVLNSIQDMDGSYKAIRGSFNPGKLMPAEMKFMGPQMTKMKSSVPTNVAPRQGMRVKSDPGVKQERSLLDQ